MNKKGFTLVELMVVVGVLSIIMLVISQPLSSVIKYQRESQQSDNMRDNLQFLMNKMEKELRTSSARTIADTGGVQILTFTDQEGDIITYSLKDGQIYRKIGLNDVPVTETNIFRVEKMQFTIVLDKLVTTSISAKSSDNQDSVTMQISTALNNK